MDDAFIFSKSVVHLEGDAVVGVIISGQIGSAIPMGEIQAAGEFFGKPMGGSEGHAHAREIFVSCEDKNSQRLGSVFVGDA